MFRRRRVAPAASSAVASLPPTNDDASAMAELLGEVGGELPAPAETRDDEALIRAAQAGDLEAFNLLVLRHERPRPAMTRR